MKKLLLILIVPLFAFTTTFNKTDINKLFKTSTLVVEAKIASKQSEWVGRKIITKVNVEVLQTYKGSSPADIQFQMLGGRSGNQELIIHGNPRIETGETVLLFLVYHKQRYSLHSMAMGYFNISKSSAEKVYYNNTIPKEYLQTHSVNKVFTDKPSFTSEEFQKVLKIK